MVVFEERENRDDEVGGGEMGEGHVLFPPAALEEEDEIQGNNPTTVSSGGSVVEEEEESNGEVEQCGNGTEVNEPYLSEDASGSHNSSTVDQYYYYSDSASSAGSSGSSLAEGSTSSAASTFHQHHHHGRYENEFLLTTDQRQYLPYSNNGNGNNGIIGTTAPGFENGFGPIGPQFLYQQPMPNHSIILLLVPNVNLPLPVVNPQFPLNLPSLQPPPPPVPNFLAPPPPVGGSLLPLPLVNPVPVPNLPPVNLPSYSGGGSGGELMQYNTTTFILDLNTSFVMNGEELPYVMNFWDANQAMKFTKPPPNLEYYVPPTVDDYDFFGGQQHMWQIKMMQFFGKFHPDLWKLQAVPDFHRDPQDGWLGFNVTSKLRFCCRTCNTPWTSKQGKILFGFMKDVPSGRGYIFMKIFGQMCMKKQKKQLNQCQDWNYQQPACYPEEIERAVQKLSEYIGYRFYNMDVPRSIFAECRKSIRLATSRSNGCNTAITMVENHHQKGLCQACLQGVCRQKL